MVTGCKLIPYVGSIITFAIQIDCDRETDLSGRYHVSKYPTIKYIQVRKLSLMIGVSSIHITYLEWSGRVILFGLSRRILLIIIS
jgi:hypothetical protein